MGAFTVICGDEEFLVQNRGREVFTEWVQAIGADEFSQETLDGRAGNQEELAEVLKQFQASVQTLSMFGETKVVWFKDISFLGDTVTGRAKGTQELLDSHLKPLLEGIDPASVRVLLTAFPVDRRRSFYKWLQKNADFQYLEGGGERDPSALYGLMSEVCSSFGVEFEAEARDLLLERVSGSARLIQIETEKLATYVGPGEGTITLEQVNSLVPHYGEANFFEAAEVFYSLNLEASLEALRRHFFTHRDARGLISSLQGRNRLLIQIRVLLDTGAWSGRITKDAVARTEARYADLFTGVEGKSGYNVFSQNPYYLSRLASTAGRVSLKNLIDFQHHFLAAFRQCIQRAQDQESVMRETFIRCLS